MHNLEFFTIFNVVLLSLVVVDFALLYKKASLKRAMFLTFLWIFLGLLFSLYVYWSLGEKSFYEYLTAYFIEKSLSVDNIFVFFIIFSRFGIKPEYQHKLLFIGIWSALILRVVMIFTIGALLSSFEFLIYVFGIFILYAGIDSFKNHDDKNNFDPKKIVSKIKKYIDIYEGNHNGCFFVKQNGKWKITILVIVICCIEFCDIVFAFDSIPALFSITDDNFIIYTSNAFAIIGLRSLYIAFASVIEKFYYIRHGVGVILCFIGMKMLLSNFFHLKSEYSLIFIVCVLIFSFVASKIRLFLLKTKK